MTVLREPVWMLYAFKSSMPMWHRARAYVDADRWVGLGCTLLLEIESNPLPGPHQGNRIRSLLFIYFNLINNPGSTHARCLYVILTGFEVITKYVRFDGFVNVFVSFRSVSLSGRSTRFFPSTFINRIHFISKFSELSLITSGLTD